MKIIPLYSPIFCLARSQSSKELLTELRLWVSPWDQLGSWELRSARRRSLLDNMHSCREMVHIGNTRKCYQCNMHNLTCNCFYLSLLYRASFQHVKWKTNRCHYFNFIHTSMDFYMFRAPEDGPVGPKHVEIRRYMNKIEIVTSVGFSFHMQLLFNLTVLSASQLLYSWFQAFAVFRT
jgi:hypothetical protein